MARIIAGLAARTYAQNIGVSSKNQFGLTIGLPGGSALGDFCVIITAAPATISTSGGAVWPVILGPSSNYRIYYRQLTAPDLVPGAITQSSNATASWGVWRGPLQLSAQRLSFNWTTPNPTNAPGFVKSLNAQVIVAVGIGATVGAGVNTSPNFIIKGSGGQFDNSTQGPDTSGSVGTGLGEIHLIDSYVNNTAFPVTSTGSQQKTTEFYELLG